MIQYIELLETEQPYVNSEFLQKEIDLWREKNNITYNSINSFTRYN